MIFNMNPYNLRKYVKISLITTIFFFLLYTIVELLALKQYYIRRYVEFHFINELQLHRDRNHHPFSNNNGNDDSEGILIPSQFDEEEVGDSIKNDNNNTNNTNNNETTTFKLTKNVTAIHEMSLQVLSDIDDLDFSGSDHHNGGLDDHHWQHHSQQNDDHSDQVKVLSITILAGIILIEIIYCAIYVYIIEQERFCPVLCFACLSLISLTQRLYQFLSPYIFDSSNSDSSGNIPTAAAELFKYSSIFNRDKFYQNIKEMDAEQLLTYMTRTDLIEVFISSVETFLVFFYAFLIKKYPGLHRRALDRYHRYQQPPNDHQPIPNGHAIEMSDMSTTIQNTTENSDDNDSNNGDLQMATNASDNVQQRLLLSNDGEADNNGDDESRQQQQPRPIIVPGMTNCGRSLLK